jgi:DeoR/GlpR family transcriptional regulator of sugar metabolism
MLYERSLTIETRLQTVLRLIEAGSYSTAELAEEIGVSVPTISRDVTALRQRGHAIRAERVGGAWHFVLGSPHPKKASSGGRKPR